ncbi:MAG: sigma 54-interacting transcriptional regulator, partial [Verrucomicrobiota bacterium]
GNSSIAVNVRVLAATNSRLETLIEQGTFREDLYYRLSVIPIEIKPLRERTAVRPGSRCVVSKLAFQLQLALATLKNHTSFH